MLGCVCWGKGTCLLGHEGFFQVTTLPEEELLLVCGLQPLLLLLPGLEHLLPPVLQGLQPFLDLRTSIWEPVLGGATWTREKHILREASEERPVHSGAGHKEVGSGEVKVGCGAPEKGAYLFDGYPCSQKHLLAQLGGPLV